MIWSWLTNMQIYKLIDSLPSFLSFFSIQNLKIFAFLDKQIKKKHTGRGNQCADYLISPKSL